MEYTTTESRDPRGVEEAVCKIYSGGSKVSQTTGQIRYKIRNLKVRTRAVYLKIIHC